eukprot:c23280_g1_i1 orf=183-1595(-)
MAPKRKRAVSQRSLSKESAFTDCPACQMKVISYLINHHLDWDCLPLVKSKERPSIVLADESAEALSKSPEDLSCNREPELHADVIPNIEPRVHNRLPVMSTKTKLHDHVIHEFEPRVYNRLLVNEKEAGLGDEYQVHKLDPEVEESLLIVHQEMDFQSQHDYGFGTKALDATSQLGTGFKLDAHCSAELGSRSPESTTGLKYSTHHHFLAGGKQSCIGFSVTAVDSEVKLNDHHNLERKEQILSCCENVNPVQEEANRVQKQAPSSPKNVKSDGWQFITTPLPSKAPKGHYVVEDFISEKEEQDILCFLDTDSKNPWKQYTFNGLHIGKAYGLSPDLKKRYVRPAVHEMPKILVPVLERMRTTVPVLKDFWPNETNAIDYYKHKGHWLKPHVDDRQMSGTILVNLSLCGDCRMTYERARGPQESYKVLLRRTCIQIQSGECRYNFTHSILNSDLLSPRRVSMTFRQSLSS